MKLDFCIEKPYEGSNEITITDLAGRCYQKLAEENAMLQYQDATFRITPAAWQAFVDRVRTLRIDAAAGAPADAPQVHWDLTIDDATLQIATRGSGAPPAWLDSFCDALKQLIGPLSFSA